MKGPNYYSHSRNRFKCKACNVKLLKMSSYLLNETMVMVSECQLILYPTQPPTNVKSSLIIILLLYLHQAFRNESKELNDKVTIPFFPKGTERNEERGEIRVLTFSSFYSVSRHEWSLKIALKWPEGTSFWYIGLVFKWMWKVLQYFQPLLLTN